MPKGKKGSPQESIDSILLAVSRRENIDVETLSHYLDRLDQEWSDGARDKVLHLLRSTDALAQSAALRILAELATDFDLDELEDFVTDPTVSDLAKLSLSPILKELGSEMADDGIVEYLNDPVGAIRQMQMCLLELVGQNEMGIETILEDVVSMPLERRFAFINWLGGSSDPRAASLLIPLLENQTGKVVFAVIDALEQLGPIAVNVSIPALNHVIASTSNRELKQHARAVLGRLTMQSMLGSEDAAMMEAGQQKLPPHEARVSSIDGAGTQLIMLSWRRPDGLIKGVNVLFQEQYGIKDCYGVDEMEDEQWRALVQDLDEQGFSCFDVPFEYARSVVLDARGLNKRLRRKLPIAYSIWRPLIETGKQPKKAVVSAENIVAPPLAIDTDILKLAQQAEDLYHEKEFSSWLYEPIEEIEAYITRYWSIQGRVEASTRGRKHNKALKEQHDLLEQLVEEALGHLITDQWRSVYEQRLRRQAALFEQVGQAKSVMLMRAIASVLDPKSGIAIREQAFPRTMIRLSIEQGPLRLMVESLRSGSFNSLPIDMFTQP